IEEIPDYRASGGDRPSWDEVNRWLIEHHGVSMYWINLAGLPCPVGPAIGYYILTGTTKSGLGHTVIARGGEVIHNPNPDPAAELVSVSMIECLVPVGLINGLPYAGLP